MTTTQRSSGLLSVVVVNWNSCADLHECLSSLARQSHPELEVIVVDNGSHDGSVSMVRSDFDSVVLLEQHDNLGFAEACNIGIDASHAAWVCMLNNDTVADDDWAKAMAAAARDAAPDCGMLQSLMLYKSRPRIINSTGVELSVTGGGRDRSEGSPRGDDETAADIFCPTAGAAAYRRSMLDAVRTAHGYFDRRHFMYYEDMDLGWRARLAGWSARYVPEAIVHHVWHGSSHRHGNDWLRKISRTNRLRMLLKNASWQLLLRTTPVMAGIALELLWRDGPAAIGRLREVTAESLSSRQGVESMRSRGRRVIERRWMVR